MRQENKNLVFSAKKISQTPLYETFRDIATFPWRYQQDKKMTAFYSQFIAKNDLIFDIGANMGNRTKIFLRLEANVIAFEPQPRCMNFLKKKWGKHKSLRLIQTALGKEVGEAEMLISNAHTLSTLSKQWISTVQNSGRFPQYSWDTKAIVPVTTLDKMIDKYGTPAFIKIDVEGFEHDVLLGLSRPIRALSIEFAPEFLDSTFACLDHVATLANIQTNYSLGESFQLCLKEWIPPQNLKKILLDLPQKMVFGDVYIRTF